MQPTRTHLRTLDLSDNAIRGEISDGFLSAMPNIEELYLNLNTLEGAIPPGIGRLTRLEVLNLDGGFTQTQIDVRTVGRARATKHIR